METKNCTSIDKCCLVCLRLVTLEVCVRQWHCMPFANVIHHSWATPELLTTTLSPIAPSLLVACWQKMFDVLPVLLPGTPSTVHHSYTKRSFLYQKVL